MIINTVKGNSILVMDNATKYHSEIVQLSHGAYIKIHQSSSIFCVQEVYLKQLAIKILNGREV